MIANELINILGFKLVGEENARRFNKTMGETERAAKQSSERVAAIGKAAGVVTTAAIVLGTQGYKNFAAFELQMKRIGITAGASSQEVVNASSDIQRLAFDFGLPIDQAVAGLDTLVSSGKSLKEAMAFLPSVLATAQASGAATADMANTAIKVSEALKINAGEMQDAFDIMVAGGKAGQFELKDMASEIPLLANQFSALGYQGTEGLKVLIAAMQTLREDTGSSGQAATQMSNILSKMYSEETANKFAKMGVDIRKEMAAGKKAGEEALDTFVRVSKEAIKGDLTKIPLLFTDMEFQAGMRSLITSGESFERFLKTLSSADVKGGAMRDLSDILDAQAIKIERLSSSWDQFMKAIGSSVAGPVGGVLDSITSGIARDQAINAGLAKQGKNWLIGRFGLTPESADELARQNGWVKPGDEQIARTMPQAYRTLGRAPAHPVTTVTRGEVGPTTTDRSGQGIIPLPGNAGLVTIASRTEKKVDALQQFLDANRPTDAGQAASDYLNGMRTTGPAFPSTDEERAARRASAGRLNAPEKGEGRSDKGMDAVAKMIEGMNANLAAMVGQAPVDATITDARQDNRQFPISVSAPVSVNVSQPTAAPAAVGAAISGAIGKAATEQSSRTEVEPAF